MNNTEIKKERVVGKRLGKQLHLQLQKSGPLAIIVVKYYLKNIENVFFTLLFPVILLFLEGFAYKALAAATPGMSEREIIASLVNAMVIMEVLGIGLSFLPPAIIDFKNSVLIKRIGATDLRPGFYILVNVLITFVMVIIAIFWTLLLAGLMFAWVKDSKTGEQFGWSIAFNNHTPLMMVFYLLTFFIATTIGLTFAAIFKTMPGLQASVTILSNLSSFLLGIFIPIILLDQIEVLKILRWLIPFKYSMTPGIELWLTGKITINWEFYVNIFVSLGLIGLFGTLAGVLTKWQQ
ncbi:ABC transporter permease [Spiroplasma chrysopicola]|uniref:Putative ABC-2 type transporter protein n=1 Tax=Spiroplasma chrysopicola DF-1 TaxID=1276227 RepID=R4U474_9MOLU|nr:ABC transporter permease [Spiroplasma chrysopicola]AGM25358.1 putative ABC-2 type transporter protein [Spiroplasma chrysopicola DF-1]